MRLSSRTHYGTRVLADLASAWPGPPISVATLAAREKLSAKYLEHIMAILKGARIVRAVQPKGYVLAKAPDKLRLHTVVWALEGSRTIRPCFEQPGDCPHRMICPSRPLWRRMERALDDSLRSATLQDVITRRL
jgi:Rrf2 family iron-sulfur cluster assembly transcriptional regulator